MTTDDTVEIGFMAIMAILFTWGFSTFIWMLVTMAQTYFA